MPGSIWQPPATPGWCKHGSAGNMSHASGQFWAPGAQKVTCGWGVQCSTDTCISCGEPLTLSGTSGSSLAHSSWILCGGLPTYGGPDVAHLPPGQWWCRSCLWHHPDQLSCGWGPWWPPHHFQPTQLPLSSCQLFGWWWCSSCGCPWLGDPPSTHPQCNFVLAIWNGAMTNQSSWWAFQSCLQFFFLFIMAGSFWNYFVKEWQRSVADSHLF